MAKKKYLFLGSNEYADVVTDSFEGDPSIVVDSYVNNLDKSNAQSGERLRPILWHEEIAAYRDTHFLLSILGTTKRKEWVDQLKLDGFRFGKLVHESSTVSKRCEIALGSLIDAGCVIAGFTQIDEHVRIGRMNSIGHHTRIHSCTTVHPGCTISGRVTIGEQVTISVGAKILPDVTIGKGAVIAAGALVKKNVAPGALVGGAPARVLKENFGPK